MRIVLQRVTGSSVRVDGSVVGSIEEGLVILIGIEPGDTRRDIDRAVEKVANMRVFADTDGHLNRSLLEVGGSALVVSQFTLLADVRKGRRPSFIGAAPPEMARPMVDGFVDALRQAGVHTETGVFGAPMELELVNAGPVTIVLEVRDGQVR
ncbi:MAG: D-aminoacyl-tRNA deacylase [Acidimicrobiia bacterium]